MKNLFFSAFIVLLSTGAAFATKKANNSERAIVPGYHFDNAQGLCNSTGEDCSTVFSDDVCTWSADGSILREFDSPTMCGNQLYKIPEN